MPASAPAEPLPEGEMNPQDRLASTPIIVGFHPLDGAETCPLPGIGVDFSLVGGASTAGTLMLDNVDKTSDAMIWEPMISPPRATMLYRPASDLGNGLHQASFTYSTPGGPVTVQWSFTVANTTACAMAPAYP
jgi:hypothetical protein